MDNNTENTVCTFALSVANRLPKWLTDTRLLYGTNVNQQLNRLKFMLHVYRLMGKKARRLYYVHGRRMDYTSSSSGCVAVRVGSLASVP